MKKIILSLPIISSIYRSFQRKQRINLLKSKKIDEVFTFIYTNNIWRGRQSISGKGSDFGATLHLMKELPNLFEEFKISSMLDIPCGDFYWMKNIDLSKIEYIGADIVVDLVKKNKKQFGRKNILFQTLNLVEDKLPKVDLIFCRDCFIHLSTNNILYSLKNICNSQSKYLLTTSYTQRKENQDIITGTWFPINLQIPPFNLPKPIKIIVDAQGKDRDKILGLWKIDDIKNSISRRSLQII